MYKLTNSNTVLRIESNSFIPFADDNSDYQTYLKWLAEGNTPLPAIEPVVEEPAPVVEEPLPVVPEPVIEPVVTEPIN